MENETFDDLASIIHQNAQPKLQKVSAGTTEQADVMIVPKGMEAISTKKFFEENREVPARRKGTVILKRLESLTDFILRHKAEETVLFADMDLKDQSLTASIRSIFDYNPAGDDITNANNGAHQAVYNFPLSLEFAFWLKKNTVAMSQIEFAHFLEARINELVVADENDADLIQGLKPKFADPLDILELSRNLEIYSSESLVSKNRLSSGETELKFSSEHKDVTGKPISIPNFFVINLPIFCGGEAQRIIAHLRYRTKEGTVTWFYELYRIDRTLEAAFETACDSVQKSTQVPLFYGLSEFR